VRAPAAAPARLAPRPLKVRARPKTVSSDAGRVLRLVRGRLNRHAVVLGAVLVVLMLAKVWLRLQVASLGYELSAARQMQLRLQQEQRELEVELATLRSPGRIGEMARHRLGMTEPKKGQVVVVR
jgi:cell division protein FtsL